MKWIIVLIVLNNVFHVKNALLPPISRLESEQELKQLGLSEEKEDEDDDLADSLTLALEDDDFEKGSNESPSNEAYDPIVDEDAKKACAIMVLPTMQNPSSQTLVRRYRYDRTGRLIPSSVKYFIKLPKDDAPAVYIPLTNSAFSPLGAYVRYYKEVPPIPQAMQK